MGSDAERAPVTRVRVLAAAVELVDTEGLESLSMRKLGAALGIEAMSLYHHVQSKDDVLNGMLDVLLAEIELPASDLVWRQQLWAIAHGFRGCGHAHPRIFPLFGSRAIRTIDGFRPVEQSYAALRSAGLDRDRALDACLSLSAYVFGYVLIELGGIVDVRHRDDVMLDGADLADHPWLVDLAAAIEARDAERQFDAGLTLQLRGIEDQVSAL